MKAIILAAGKGKRLHSEQFSAPKVLREANGKPLLRYVVNNLSFIPDNVIIGGYGSLYLLGQRSGAVIATSEHVRFMEDQTVAKGVARYDGMPVVPAGFVAIGISGAAVEAGAVAFTADAANTPPDPGT